MSTLFRPEFDYNQKERWPELEKLHDAADCCEFADVEDFIEQFLPDLNKHSPTELWALAGILFGRGYVSMAKFVIYYVKYAEPSAAAALAGWRAEGETWLDYMPSPFMLWGRWCEKQGNRAGLREGWQKAEKWTKENLAKEQPVQRSLTVYHRYDGPKP